MRARRRGLRAGAIVLGALVSLAWVRTAAAAPPRTRAAYPRDSPLHGPPYRDGLTAEVAIGLSLCQPTLIHAGSCSARSGSGPTPGVALRVGGGWRFGPHWLLSGAWVRQGHRPGGSFTGGFADGGIVAVRGIVPLARRDGGDSRIDLGFELGLGWSQRVLTRDAAPDRLTSSGALIRPALVLDGWVLADLAIGLELAPHFNLHWQHCVDEVCELAPGPWVTAEVDRRWINGFTLAVRVGGVLSFARLP